MAQRTYESEDYKQVRRLKTARRSLTYLVRTVMIIILGIMACAMAFLICERLSNLYILTSEGMKLRNECILSDGNVNELDAYFTEEWIEADSMLYGTVYDDYELSSVDYSLSIEKISVLPWSVTATVTVIESCTVKGTIRQNLIDEEADTADYPAPAYETTRCKLHYVYQDARWYIASIEIVEIDPEVEPLASYDPNVTARPMATATPAPTEEP